MSDDLVRVSGNRLPAEKTPAALAAKLRSHATGVALALRHLLSLARRVRRKAAMSPVKVLIADDHPMLATGVAAVLSSHGIETVETIARVEDLLPTYERVKPDVVILDIMFSPQSPSGIDAARELLQRHPLARVLFYSQFDQDSIVDEAYKVGGRAFVLKDCSAADLAALVRQVAESDTPVFLPQVASRIALMRYRGNETPEARLDTREYQVFQMLAYGWTFQEIAERLNLSTKTASSIANDVKAKLGLRSVKDLHALAIQHQVKAPT